MAMECFIIDADQWDPKACKPLRYCGKNMFVFPQFYGDYFVDCATMMWNEIVEQKLKMPTGELVVDHLAKHGIKSLGRMEKSKSGRHEPTPRSFMSHIRDVEESFWQDRYSVYTEWKEDFFDAYNEVGYFDTFTGFRCSGVMKRNEVLNYPVQGPAFHCLLWSLIELNDWLKEKRMKTMIIGQIHDSIVFDLAKDEVFDVLAQAQRIMCDDIREEWKWLTVPLEIEAEVAPVNESWWKKQEVKLTDGPSPEKWERSTLAMNMSKSRVLEKSRARGER